MFSLSEAAAFIHWLSTEKRGMMLKHTIVGNWIEVLSQADFVAFKAAAVAATFC